MKQNNSPLHVYWMCVASTLKAGELQDFDHSLHTGVYSDLHVMWQNHIMPKVQFCTDRQLAYHYKHMHSYDEVNYSWFTSWNLTVNVAMSHMHYFIHLSNHSYDALPTLASTSLSIFTLLLIIMPKYLNCIYLFYYLTTVVPSYCSLFHCTLVTSAILQFTFS